MGNDCARSRSTGQRLIMQCYVLYLCKVCAGGPKFDVHDVIGRSFYPVPGEPSNERHGSNFLVWHRKQCTRPSLPGQVTPALRSASISTAP